AATKVIEDIIRAIAASGIKVVMATHDLGEAKRLAGDIVLLHRGRVVERAGVPEFLSAPRTAEARAFVAGGFLVLLQHDPPKWRTAFRKDHSPTKKKTS